MSDDNECNSNGETAVYKAARNGHIDVVKALIESYGAKVNINRNDGRSPLMAAVENGDDEVIKTLLSYGAKYDQVANDGSSALVVAATVDNLSAIQLLLNYGANINFRTIDDDTALSICTKRGNVDIAMVLLEKYQEAKCRCDVYDALVMAKQIDNCQITNHLQAVMQPRRDLVNVSLKVTVRRLPFYK